MHKKQTFHKHWQFEGEQNWIKLQARRRVRKKGHFIMFLFNKL